jgi:hypothetical protein
VPVNIHGREYITVAERVQEAHKELKTISITTEILSQSPVVVKATVITPKGTFTGVSAANPTKAIEKMSPYEVAETSAVGRALGFAGYGIVEGIASADEVAKATAQTEQTAQTAQPEHFCALHQKPMKERQSHHGGTYYDHRWQNKAKAWQKCNGRPLNTPVVDTADINDYI